MQFEQFLKCVSKIEKLPLLGEVSHAKLSPPFRMEMAKKMKNEAKFAKQAGVLALFYPNTKGETTLIFILRKTYNGKHSGQVAFPGGKYELEDENLKTTAIRETEEEIGIPKSEFTVTKTLSPLYIPPSNFMVHPFMGISKNTPQFIKQDTEVEALIEVPLSSILNENSIINTPVKTSYTVTVNTPAFHLKKHIIWGATAMILSEIKDLLKQVL